MNKTLSPGKTIFGTVLEVHPKLCRIWLDGETLTRVLPYRRATVWKAERGERSPLVVGDRVRVQLGEEDGESWIEERLERENSLARTAPTGEDLDPIRPSQHILASNLDGVVIVASAIDPEFRPGLVDRFLIACQSQNLFVRIVITKVDKISADTPRAWDLYREFLPVFEVSVVSEVGLESLEALLSRRVVFCGHSGVGKTTLLRKMIPTYQGRIGDTNVTTGKGRHTTTSALGLPTEAGGLWIDTPGIRGFGLIGVNRENLKDYYSEFEGIGCVSPHCMHLAGVPGCKALGLPRWDSYLRIHESLESLPEWKRKKLTREAIRTSAPGVRRHGRKSPSR